MSKSLRVISLCLACFLLVFLAQTTNAAPRPQAPVQGIEPQAAEDLEAGADAEEKDLQGASSYGYGYYSPYIGGSYYGGYYPYYSSGYYGLGYPYYGGFGYGGYGGYGGYYGGHHHSHYGHYF